MTHWVAHIHSACVSGARPLHTKVRASVWNHDLMASHQDLDFPDQFYKMFSFARKYLLLVDRARCCRGRKAAGRCEEMWFQLWSALVRYLKQAKALGKNMKHTSVSDLSPTVSASLLVSGYPFSPLPQRTMAHWSSARRTWTAPPRGWWGSGHPGLQCLKCLMRMWEVFELFKQY